MCDCTCITFHLKEALDGFSLVYLNCQHRYSHALEQLLSKIRVTGTQVQHDASTVSLIPETAAKRLIGRLCTRYGYAGHMAGSCPGRTMEWEGMKFHHAT